MKKLLLGSAATLLSAVAAPALAADLPVLVAPVPVFSWTSCFMGAHVGGAWAQDNFTDPAALVENGILGTVVPPGASVGVNSNGLIIGGQMGCDYQFGFSPWVVGAEGAVSGANLSGKSDVALPLGNPGDLATVTSKTDFFPSATARVGYALANWLFYLLPAPPGPATSTASPAHSRERRSASKAWTTVSAGRQAPAWNGPLRKCGRRGSNTTISPSATAAHSCPMRSTDFRAG
jgi:opacity protein-like surface antigen